MENGVEIVEGSHIGEVKGMEHGVIEKAADENVSRGFHQPKDSEGDDVFEEAIEQLREQSAETDSVNETETAETIQDSGLVPICENSSVLHEGETFEEAIGVPGEVGNHKEPPQLSLDNVKVDDLMGKEATGGVLVADRIDEGGGTTEEIKENKFNGLVGDNNGNKVSDVGVHGNKEVLKDVEEVEENDDVVFEKSENGNLDSVNLGYENVDADKAGDNYMESHTKDESNGEILHLVSKTENLNHNMDTDSQHDGKKELNDASAGFYLQNQREELNGLTASDIVDKDNSSGELAVDSASIAPAYDKNEELKNTLLKIDTEHHNNGELKGASASLGSRNQDDEGEGIEVVLADLDSEHQDGRSGGLDDSSSVLDSVHNGETLKKIDISGNLHASMEDDAVASERGSLPFLKESVDKNEKTQVGPSDLVAERSQLQCVDKNVDGVAVSEEEVKDVEKKQTTQVSKEREIQLASGVSSSFAKSLNPATSQFILSEKPEMKEAKDEEAKEREIQVVSEVSTSFPKSRNPTTSKVTLSEKPEKAKDEEAKQSIQGSKEREKQHAAGLSSSSVKSLNPASLPARPAGLGHAAPLLDPAPRAVQQPRANGTVSQMQTQLVEDPTNGEAEENDETREKLQMIRVKFLRLAHRLGQTPHNVVVAQVLYRLGLAEQLRGRNGSRVGAFSFDRASAMAEQLEAAGQEPLDFSCTIMILGKTGVGKSATINSIFDEVKFGTDAFQLGTKKVQDVVGTVQGIKVRVIDTPGLLSSWSDQRQNEKILHSVKRFIKKTPPDIVLYLDRLDMQSRDSGDMPLLRTITEIFGPSIWFNAIVVLTHAASAPPDGPNGTATSYDMFVTQRSHVVQQSIRQAAGDLRLMNPVSLVENHSACRTNRNGQRVLPNGQVWKPHLLLLSFASKVLAEANTLLKMQDSPPGKPFATRSKSLPLPFLLSSLLQSRPQLKLPEEQFGDDDTLDDDLEESLESDDDSEYEELPPFKRLTKAQLEKLSKAQKKAYFEELEYREKLFMKKQLKEERKRLRMLKKMAASAKDLPSDYSENMEEESGGPATLPVPMPDLALPASFDSDNPTHRYRCLDTSSQWLVRPSVETYGWDHDVGYETINAERLFVVKDKIPISFNGQITKDKKDANLQLEVASSLKHGEGKATSLGFDMQTVGKDLSYTLRSESRFSNFWRNKATAGLSVTVLGDAVSAGMKLEDKVIVNKRFRVVMSGGAMMGRGDVAYGGSLEATLRDKDYPLGRSLSTLGLSVMDWHGDLAIGGHLQSQIPIGRSSNVIARANLNNRGSGQISIRLNSSEQLQIVLVGLIPLLRKLLGYSQQMQFGQ